jgi:ribulose-bisphosphate carboxylase large chain
MVTDGTEHRIEISYAFALEGDEPAESRARGIALEQTVELPDGCYPRDIEPQVVGRVERVAPGDDGRYLATISYPADLVGSEIPALLNLMFGNISMQRDIVVTDVVLPPEILKRIGGPRFGLDGVQDACGGIRHRPLLCSAAKPIGLTTFELAARCAAMARGGIDVVKDDHSVMDQPMSPFRERVSRCQEAVTLANDDTGGHTLYFPNVTAPYDLLDERVEYARSVGCRGVLMSPFVMGFDAVRMLADSSGLLVFAHPTFSGSLLQEGHGFLPGLLFGTLLRVVGADGVIYVNVGGRFPVSERDCTEINERLRAPLDGLRPAMPIPGGGVEADSVAMWGARYGTNVMFLIGSSLYAQADLQTAVSRLVEALERRNDG